MSAGWSPLGTNEGESYRRGIGIAAGAGLATILAGCSSEGPESPYQEPPPNESRLCNGLRETVVAQDEELHESDQDYFYGGMAFGIGLTLLIFALPLSCGLIGWRNRAKAAEARLVERPKGTTEA